MDFCSKKITPSGYNVSICTSDVTCYDGPSLSAIATGPTTTLNNIIAQVDTLIYNLQQTLGTPTAADIIYNGTLSFGCITIPGSSSVEDVIELLATQICTNTTTIAGLTGDDIGIGTVSTYCYTLPGSVDTVSEVFSFIFENMCNLQTQIDALATSLTAPLTGTTNGLMDGADIVARGGNRSTAGLNVTINDGAGQPSEYIVNGTWKSVAEDTVALTATADNYVDYDPGTDAYVVTAVTIAAPEPPVVGIRLWKFETNALNVVSEEDRRVYSWVSTTLINDSAVTTAKIADLAVTGLKMETLGAGGTLGNANIFTLTYDTKGRVTGTTFNMAFAGLTSGDLISWDGAQFVNTAPSWVDGTGTTRFLAKWVDADTLTNSLLEDDGSTMALGTSLSATTKMIMRTTTLDYTLRAQNVNAGTIADVYGIRGSAQGGTDNNIGIYGEGNGVIGSILEATTQYGIVGTAFTDNAFYAVGMMAVASGNATSTNNVFGLKVKSTTSGSGVAYGIHVESGRSLFGGTTLAAGAAFQIDSTTGGLLIPRMTGVEANAITATNGLIVYITATNPPFTSVGFWGYQGGAWGKF